MANARIQPTRALTIAKSDFADIPLPSIALTGSDSAGNPNELVDSSKDFVQLNIYTGDIVYNVSTLPYTSATVIANPLPSAPDTLILNDSIMNSGDAYIIYQSSPLSGGKNSGCVLYVGTGGDVTVTTAGGDIVTFVAVQNGSFLPVQVLKVWNSGTSADILALW